MGSWPSATTQYSTSRRSVAVLTRGPLGRTSSMRGGRWDSTSTGSVRWVLAAAAMAASALPVSQARRSMSGR